jgi:hypothetical protein
MITRTILAAAAAVALVAAAAATAGLTTSTAKDPKTLVLQKSDLPSGARLARTLDYAGGLALTYRYRTQSSLIDLTSSAAVVKSRSQATAAFKQARTGFEQILKKLTKGTGYAYRLNLPRYGDEQLATFHHLDGGKLLVRKNTVVWMILLQSLPATGVRQITKAEAVAELKRLGLKQQRRVGSG